MPRRDSFTHIVDRNYEAGRLDQEVSHLKQQGVFSDEEFPPTVKSLINPREVPPFVLDVPKFTRRTAWKRAPGISKDNQLPPPPLYTVEQIAPTAVKQGGLENCYFLASLTSLSQHPDRITRLFLPQSNHNAGIYAVRTFVNGAPKEVVVDDWLPIEKNTNQLPKNPLDNLPRGTKIHQQTQHDNGNGTTTRTLHLEYPNGRMQIKTQTTDTHAVTTQLQFSRTTTNELWVPILEKAYAKLQGSYATLEAGSQFETIRDLTGAPGFYYTSVDKDHHWPLLQHYHNTGYPLSCGIDYKYGMPHSAQALQKAGLVPTHVYSLLVICTVTTGNGKQQRLLKLRNPWGDAMEWTGEWGNKSPLWTSNIRNQIQQQGIALEDPNAQNGIFWMAWEDFANYFNSWDVNKYHDAHQFSATILDDNNAGDRHHLVSVHVQQSGAYTFGISQCSHRMMPTSAKYKYSSVRGILVQASQSQPSPIEEEDQENWINVSTTRFQGCRFLKGVVGEERDHYIEMENLEPGMYYLYVQVWWDPSSKHLPSKEISVNCYGTARVKFDKDVAPAFGIETVLTELFAAKARQALDENIVSRKRGQPEAQKIQEYYNRGSCPEGYHYRLICNLESNNMELQENKKFVSLRNARLVQPSHKNYYSVTGRRGGDAYSISVKPGETKGVFLMVQSSFGMAGPSGTATLIMPDGSSVQERENQQAVATQANLPPNTGVVPNSAAQPIPLETLHTGGGKGGGFRHKSRKASILGSMLASMRGSTAVGPPDVRKSKREDEGDHPSKRRSVFSGWFGKKNKDNRAAPSVPQDSFGTATSPAQANVQQQVHRPIQQPSPPPQQQSKQIPHAPQPVANTSSTPAASYPTQVNVQKAPQPIPPRPPQPAQQQPKQTKKPKKRRKWWWQKSRPTPKPKQKISQPHQQQTVPPQKPAQPQQSTQPPHRPPPQQSAVSIQPAAPASSNAAPLTQHTQQPRHLVPQTPEEQQQAIPNADGQQLWTAPTPDQQKQGIPGAIPPAPVSSTIQQTQQSKPPAPSNVATTTIQQPHQEATPRAIPPAPADQQQQSIPRAPSSSHAATTTIQQPQQPKEWSSPDPEAIPRAIPPPPPAAQQQQSQSSVPPHLQQPSHSATAAKQQPAHSDVSTQGPTPPTAPEAAAPPVQKTATFQNLGSDPTMAKAELYYESTRWGPLGHGDPPVAVGSFPGHRWFVVSNGVYAKMFTVGEEDQQTFTF